VNGVRMEIEVDGQQEDIFFATRRADAEKAAAMKQAKERYYEATAKVAGCTQRVALAGQKAQSLNKRDKQFAEKLEAIGASQESVLDELCKHRIAMQNAAEEFCRHSLEENYGKDAGRIMQALTDGQIDDLVGVITTGEVPEDFFPRRATPPSATTISDAKGRKDTSSSSTR